MPLKFRLRGLAETFVEQLVCPCCGNDGGEKGDEGFGTTHTKVTYDGIVVVMECLVCGHVFVPDNQRLGVIDLRKLKQAVDKDSETSGQPIIISINAVRLDVERLNAVKSKSIH